ncbi:MAG: hypothetical protein QMD23_07340 [Candidatus Bathyarchaeia archaeon]|nr:hypothetical protein [Candidatus Bathyarchaeia archaeon]
MKAVLRYVGVEHRARGVGDGFVHVEGRLPLGGKKIEEIRRLMREVPAG